jgi:hypothetical protein
MEVTSLCLSDYMVLCLEDSSVCSGHCENLRFHNLPDCLENKARHQKSFIFQNLKVLVDLCYIYIFPL